MKRKMDVLLVVIILAGLISGCNVIDQKTLDVLNHAIQALNDAPGRWRETTTAVIDELGKVGSATAKQVLADVETTYNHMVGVSGSELRCDTDFVGRRMNQELQEIRHEYFTKFPGPTITPVICTIDQRDIQVDLNGTGTSIVHYFGYDFDALRSGKIRSVLQYADGEVINPAFGNITVASNYEFAVNLAGFRYSNLIRQRGPKLVVAWNDAALQREDNNGKPMISELSVVLPPPPPTFMPRVSSDIPIQAEWPNGGGETNQNKDWYFHLLKLPEGCRIDESRGGDLDLKEPSNPDDPNGATYSVTLPKGYHIEFGTNTIVRSLWRLEPTVDNGNVSVTVTLRGLGHHGMFGSKGPERFEGKFIVYYECPVPTPELWWDEPKANAVVSGVQLLKVKATGAHGILFTAYYQLPDGKYDWRPIGKGNDTGPDEWTFAWDTRTVPNQDDAGRGLVNLAANALDESGQPFPGVTVYRRVGVSNAGPQPTTVPKPTTMPKPTSDPEGSCYGLPPVCCKKPYLPQCEPS